MFDFHLHSGLSHDSTAVAAEMIAAAEARGLQEICFTDHYDLAGDDPRVAAHLFTMEEYGRTYDALRSERVKVRLGLEFGLTTDSQRRAEALVAERHFDFIIGSVHSVYGLGPFNPRFWEGRSVKESFQNHLEHTLRCVRANTEFDVLGHLNYVCKSPHNPTKEPLRYGDYPDLFDEIMKEIIAKGKGMEVNTSGVDSVGMFLPDAAYLKRYRELGGEIVTVGSDAHTVARVGNHIAAALDLIRDLFGYVCTFEDRKPIYHKL